MSSELDDELELLRADHGTEEIKRLKQELAELRAVVLRLRQESQANFDRAQQLQLGINLTDDTLASQQDKITWLQEQIAGRERQVGELRQELADCIQEKDKIIADLVKTVGRLESVVRYLRNTTGAKT
jgi:chromosome segregation ATPase